MTLLVLVSSDPSHLVSVRPAVSPGLRQTCCLTWSMSDLLSHLVSVRPVSPGLRQTCCLTWSVGPVSPGLRQIRLTWSPSDPSHLVCQTRLTWSVRPAVSPGLSDPSHLVSVRPLKVAAVILCSTTRWSYCTLYEPGRILTRVIFHL